MGDWDETMTTWLVFFFLSALVRAAPTSISENTCAPLAVQSNFNYSEYLRSSWYVQKQQMNGYQPASSLNCVVATYNEAYHGTPAKVPFFSGEVFSVFNDCRLDAKDGPVCHNDTSPDAKPSFGNPLCGRVIDK